jgi:hypothetical protein
LECRSIGRECGSPAKSVNCGHEMKALIKSP